MHAVQECFDGSTEKYQFKLQFAGAFYVIQFYNSKLLEIAWFVQLVSRKNPAAGLFGSSYPQICPHLLSTCGRRQPPPEICSPPTATEVHSKTVHLFPQQPSMAVGSTRGGGEIGRGRITQVVPPTIWPSEELCQCFGFSAPWPSRSCHRPHHQPRRV